MNDGMWYTNRLQKSSENKADDHRSPYEKDSCRVVHSYIFRRLQGKIQIVSGNESDFHRNRLTHSIEVASIAKNLFSNLKCRFEKNKDEELSDFFKSQDKHVETLLSTLGLLHDIGHPPFGHGGEQALNYKMHSYGGFEGNAQTLRLITKISPLNLTYRTLLGTLKYPVKYSNLEKKELYPIEYNRRAGDQIYASKYLINKSHWTPPKCYYDEDEGTVSELLQFLDENDRLEFQKQLGDTSAGTHDQAKYKTFDCSIMDIADDISYSIHDLEDALFFNLISLEDLEDFFSNQKFIKKWKDYPQLLVSKDSTKRKKIISQLIHEVIIDTSIAINDKFSQPLLRYNAVFGSDEAREFIFNLKKMVKDKLINTQHVKSIIHGGMVVIMQLFDAFTINPDLLPESENEKLKNANDRSHEYDCKRIIADYISGMTDQYLFKMHQRLYGANNQNTFDVI